MYSKESLKNIFQNKISESLWRTLLVNLFNADEMRAEHQLISDEKEIDKGYYIGKLNTSDGYCIGLFS